MRERTRQRLDAVSKSLARRFVGAMSQDASRIRGLIAETASKMDSRCLVDFFRKTFREGGVMIPIALNADGVKITDRQWLSFLKTYSQTVYVANEVARRVKGAAWRDKSFGTTFRASFGFKPHTSYVQMELPL